ncbi:unnamed protein product [Urochloa humidicola]
MKELRLANEAKVASTTALLAATGSTASSCTSPGGCRSTAAGPGNSGGFVFRPPGDQKKSGSGGNKWRKKGKQAGGPQQQQTSGQPHPTGPWICFNPYAAYGALGQQAGAAQCSTGGWQASPQSLLGPRPQAHTAFTLLQMSAPAPQWDQAGLAAALNQMSLQGG